MADINTSIFTGRMVTSPEMKLTAKGKEVCSFALACEEGYKDSKRVSYPEFVAWEGKAKFAAKLPKGTKVVIRARYTERHWETKDGAKRKACEFVVDELVAADNKRASEPSEPAPYSAEAPEGFEPIDNDSDLPF